MNKFASLWLIFSLFLLLLHPIAGVAQSRDEGIQQSLEEKSKNLQEIKRKIDTEKDRVREDTRKEKGIAAELAKIKRQLEKKRREATKLQRDINWSQSRVNRLNKEIEASQARLAKAKSLLAWRLRAIYKQGKTGLTSLLLSANSLHQATVNLRYLQAIAHHDHQLIHDFKMAIAVHKEKKGEVEQQVQKLSSSQRALNAKQREIAQDEEQKKALFAKVRSDKAESLQRLSELRKSAAALQTLIGQLKKRMEALQASAPKGEEVLYLKGLHFASVKGKLLWPAQGELISTFGRQEHPRYRTFTLNKGIDIAAPMGREIKAVYEGIVLFADWFRGYGKMAIIDHGGGFFSLYAHASELLVKAGDKVASRQAIGRVGDLGSPEGPRLHFEIRQDGAPVDPLKWLIPNPPGVSNSGG